mgnify:CR=1 FL=1
MNKKKILPLLFALCFSLVTYAQQEQAAAPQKDTPSDYWDMLRSTYSLDGGESIHYRMPLERGQIAFLAISAEDRYAEMEYTITNASGKTITSDFCNGETFYFESPSREEYDLKVENTGDARGYFTVVLYRSRQ